MTSILIESVNYNGQEVNVVFNPAGTELSINLGTQIIPFEFNPYLLVPSFDGDDFPNLRELLLDTVQDGDDLGVEDGHLEN